jgi:catechol 2,3-dioxygenase-like lactoylglutathione lyase family enzyme
MLQIKDSNVTVMVNDMDKAIQFYESIGLVLKQRWENYYAMIKAGDLTIGLHPSNGGATGSGAASIGFMIDKIEDGKAILDKANIAYKQENGGSGHYLNFQDPWGTHLYFVQPGW